MCEIFQKTSVASKPGITYYGFPHNQVKTLLLLSKQNSLLTIPGCCMEQLWRASGRRGKSIAPSHPHPGLLLWIGFKYVNHQSGKHEIWNIRKIFHWSLGITVADDVWTHWLCTTWNKLWKLALGIRIEILLLSPQRSENKAAVKQRTAGLRYGRALLLSCVRLDFWKHNSVSRLQ